MLIQPDDIIAALENYYGVGNVRDGIASEIALNLDRSNIGMAAFGDILAIYRQNCTHEFCPTWRELKKYRKPEPAKPNMPREFMGVLISDWADDRKLREIYGGPRRPIVLEKYGYKNGDEARLGMIEVLRRNVKTDKDKQCLKGFIRQQTRYMTNPPAPDSRDDVDCRSGAGG